MRLPHSPRPPNHHRPGRSHRPRCSHGGPLDSIEVRVGHSLLMVESSWSCSLGLADSKAPAPPHTLSNLHTLIGWAASAPSWALISEAIANLRHSPGSWCHVSPLRVGPPCDQTHSSKVSAHFCGSSRRRTSPALSASRLWSHTWRPGLARLAPCWNPAHLPSRPPHCVQPASRQFPEGRLGGSPRPPFLCSAREVSSDTTLYAVATPCSPLAGC